MDKRARIVEVLEKLSSRVMVEVYNRYCDEANYPNDRIEDNTDEFLNNMYPTGAEMASQLDGNSNYGYRDDYARLDGLGNLESTDSPEDWVEFDEVARYAEDNDEDFGDDEIREILDEEEESDDNDDDDE
jgi:hypothetical protein